GAGAPGRHRLRLGRAQRLHRGHGRRTGRLPRPGGRTDGRAVAGPRLTAHQALAAWLEHLKDERRASPRTLEAYGFAVGRYIDFLERHRGEAVTLAGLGAVSAAEVRAFLAFLRQGESPLSPRS